MVVAMGNSGAVFKRLGDQISKTIVVPYGSDSTLPSQRLLLQANKQTQFLNGDTVKAPRVHAAYCSPEQKEQGLTSRTTILMDYVEGRNPLLVADYEKHVETMARWVRSNHDQGEVRWYPGSQFLEKLSSLRRTIDDPDLDGLFGKLSMHFRDGVALTHGRTHGDLTFCNVLLDGDGVLWLIDFLEPFVDVVEMDMAKLRQDTADQWITLFATVADSTLTRADTILDDAFLVCPGYRRHGDALRAINLLRALPYATRDNVRSHIYRRLRCLPFS